MPEDLVWHHRTWWAVTSQKGGRGKTLLLCAMSRVQALSSLEGTQGCSNTAGGVAVSVLHCREEKIEEKRELTRAKEMARKNEKTMWGQGKRCRFPSTFLGLWEFLGTA